MTTSVSSIKQHITALLSEQHVKPLTFGDLEGSVCCLHVDIDHPYSDKQLVATVRELNVAKVHKLVVLIEDSSRAYFEKLIYPELDLDELRNRLTLRGLEYVQKHSLILRLFKGILEYRHWCMLKNHEDFPDFLTKVQEEFRDDELYRLSDLKQIQSHRHYKAVGEEEKRVAESNRQDYALEFCAGILTWEKVNLVSSRKVFFISWMPFIKFFRYYCRGAVYHLDIDFQDKKPSLLPEPESVNYVSPFMQTKCKNVASFYTLCQISADAFRNSACFLHFSLTRVYDSKKNLEEDLDEDFIAVINALNRHGAGRVVLLIEDSASVHYEKILHPDTPLKKLRKNYQKKEKEWIKERQELLNRLACEYHIMDWGTAVAHHLYPSCLEFVKQRYHLDLLFKEKVDETVSVEMKKLSKLKMYRAAIKKDSEGAKQSIKEYVFEKCAIILLREKLYTQTRLISLYFTDSDGQSIPEPIEHLQQYRLEKYFKDVSVQFSSAKEQLIESHTETQKEGGVQ